jgi:hypothetical protein
MYYDGLNPSHYTAVKTKMYDLFYKQQISFYGNIPVVPVHNINCMLYFLDIMLDKYHELFVFDFEPVVKIFREISLQNQGDVHII